MMRNKWLFTALMGAASALWLVWAAPRLHPAARLGLQFDREGYLDQARKVAANNGADISGWRGYALLSTKGKNQDLHHLLPGNQTAAAFPDVEVETNSLPNGKGNGAKITLRADGTPLDWKLPEGANAASGTPPDLVAANALRQIVGQNEDRFQPDGTPIKDSDGSAFKWKRADSGTDLPAATVEITVRNGHPWRANTTFRYPPMPSSLKVLTASRVTVSVIWWILLLIATIVPLLREGGGAAARGLKDASAIRLSIAAAAAVMISTLLEWDDEMISVPAAAGISTEILGVVLGAVLMGLLFYLMSAATALNARMHALAIRGFRLLGTPAFFSRNTGAEILGGWMASPFLLALPLALAQIFHAPGFKLYDDSFPLVRWPALDALTNIATQDTITVLTLAGVLIPLAIRWFRPRWLRWIVMALLSIMTFVMLTAPFRNSAPANLIYSAVYGLTVLWLYFRFGMLGALSGHCSVRILNSAVLLLVQPASSLHASGWGVLMLFAAIGGISVFATLRAPEAVTELYGESSARVQTRSRREELLAEFHVARAAQEQMLPAKAPQLDGYTIAASCIPAREVGGDLYDFLRLRDGKWGIGVADVSGKGVPASLYMTLTKGLLCAAAQESDDPRHILGAVNKHLRTVTKRKMFVTMAMGVLDPAAKRMEYVRAGHNPVVWRKRSTGETTLLTGNGIGLGIAGPALFAKTLTASTLDLGPGDALVFYSDGLTEAMNSELEQFGEDRLIAAVEKTDGMHATDTRDSILKEVRRFLEGGQSQDDLTIAVLRVNAQFENAEFSSADFGDGR